MNEGTMRLGEARDKLGDFWSSCPQYLSLLSTPGPPLATLSIERMNSILAPSDHAARHKM
jgi:hypothetical protein